MKRYKQLNILLGWLSFLIAAITYISTIEPTASFWDCGEFIASAYKLEVGHPPGAPLFMIVARIFSLFAFGDVTKVAMMVNLMSALASAFTVLFLFWTITHIAKKIVTGVKGNVTQGKMAAILGSGFVGALAYTFSDTFWFSAVEGEVYAFSSLFTAIVFWAILKWENVADEKYANRWLIFIAYLMGLSIGVHLLSLLTIPAIVFVYYFRKYKPTTKGIFLAALISIITLGSIQYGIIPGIVSTASQIELLFVNSFGLPYHSGIIFYALLLIVSLVGGLLYTYKKDEVIKTTVFASVALIFLGIPFAAGNILLNLIFLGGLVYGIYYLSKNQKAVLNTILLAATVIVIGYSSFTMIVIRSIADPPMDENNPENLFSLLSYLNREQYGNAPLLYGQYYNAPVEEQKDGKNFYTKKDGKYVVTNTMPEYIYDSRFETVFPRMYSSQGNHVSGYKSWANIKGKPVTVQNRRGEAEQRMKPTFFENLKFFFKYQIGHMYVRYFMWNFAGRQNDNQGHGGYTKGNWISGIKVLDEVRLGNQDKLPDTMKNNKARNTYFLLPLILGIIGLVYTYVIRPKSFWVILLLFFFTGIAIILYTNQPPYQPRERDYAYAGSFYAFAIWIGLGVLGIIHEIQKAIAVEPAIETRPGVYAYKEKTKISTGLAVAMTALFLLLVPGIMAKENWDDHDRSGRYTARDFAYNYLQSCAPNAILFTYGDNDTFPLWYAQEVEGIRTDVRVVNLSLLATDWYIEQMKRKAYESEPVPFSMTKDQYIQGKRDIVPVTDNQQLFFEEKYAAYKEKFEPEYRKYFEELMETLRNTQFTQDYSQDFAKMEKGYQHISPLRFYGLVSNLLKEENIFKYNLDAEQMKLLKSNIEDLITAIAESHLPVRYAIDFVASDNQNTKIGDGYDYLPSHKLLVPVDKKKVLENGTVPPEYASKIVDNIEWNITQNYLGKNDLMIIDLLATNNWERPVYFAASIGRENMMNLQDYVQLEGWAYRIVPFKTENTDMSIGHVNTEIMYKNVMKVFKWGRMNQPDFFMDYQNKRTMNIIELKKQFARLANALLNKGKNEKAIAVLDKMIELLPHEKVPYDYQMLSIIEAYYEAGESEKANKILLKLAEVTYNELQYYRSLSGRFANALERESDIAENIIRELARIALAYEQEEISKEIQTKYMQ